ncbi:cobyrinate a,c-diamide synthase [Peteryoungia desertarenae]|uniref:Hydrogenobyrinate a,c-diamide synthase n=1 Tax=Peteryoungia desertarenae TaxID=1813451 RepID=A0ABX6QQ04_9HYPH|nr:cobyrinate a,c-diamide synthase [Peteryoungia desertarenae]QLF70603.1 cobyrinate a,c-diamide synthase [Peteryoungia desertarenae]
MSGLLIAAPASGSGKTVVTLGLMRALKRLGVKVAPGKAGPDYIDPAFHQAASGETYFNFDPWAMRRAFLRSQAAVHGADRLLLVEAMMGLFDGAADGTGSAADLAALLELPVVMVVDCGRMSQSVAALVSGYVHHRADVRVAGVILNRVGSERHEAMLRAALERIPVPVLGVIRSHSSLALPERHLGLVQAREHDALETFIENAADVVTRSLDLQAILSLAEGGPAFQDKAVPSLPPLGQHIAIARDEAFAFCYPHLVEGWRRQGAEISFFSPLANEAPNATADAIYLPGGYPELHAGRLTTAFGFQSGVKAAAEQGARIYGECGGYMVLGEGLIDATGLEHRMLGLLPLVTSFAQRKRHLGYRRLRPLANDLFEGGLTGHEFHYSTVVSEGDSDRLFGATDALGEDLGAVGLRRGKISGSYMHVIDLAEVAA